jgi:hypothetical protein
MHRSRPPVFAIFAAVAACSSRHDPDANEILSQDSTLVATLEVRKAPQQPLPDACGTTAVAARPATADKELAEELARQAYDAELLGNMSQARSLLVRASTLDGTDKSAAYHLGRTSEVLGDRSGALTAYCRYLTLTPTTAESSEARQRVAELSRTGVQVAMGSVSSGATVHRRVQPPTTRRVTRVEHAARATPNARRTYSLGTATNGAQGSPTPGDGMTTSSGVGSAADRTMDGGDAVTTQPSAPSVDQPSTTTSRTAGRGPSRVQSAGIGAVAGAIIGAATGRSVKSAVIGAAAGGIVGTVVGGSIRPSGGGVRPAARYRLRPAA